MNRLKQYLEDEESPTPEGDYWIIKIRYSYVIVSADTARTIDQLLARFWCPRWLVFRDLNGAQRRLRTAVIESLYESTTKQRAYRRAFDRDRKLEEIADRRPWEDYD
jgi:hypothetical protein